MRSLSSVRWLAAAFVGSASLALYLVTLAPTITWANFGADGGDLITAAVTSGVPHPPGYPVYTTLGYLFAQLPIGTVAFRLNFFSAMCMALAAALVTWSVTAPTPNLPRSIIASNRRGSKHPPLFAVFRGRGRAGVGVGVLAGLTFAVTPMVWGQATIAEVHALNALFVAAILALFVPIIFRGEPVSTRRLSFALFVWGLSLTHQLTALALAPLFFVAVRRSFITRHSSLVTHCAVRLARYVLPFLLALTPCLLLLPRAAAQPPINWLGEVTLANFWSVITAELYRGYVFALPLSDYPARLIAFAQLLVAQFGWVGLALIGLGLYRGGRRALAPLLSCALYVIFAVSYNTADSQVYLTPVWLFGAWAVATGTPTLIHHSSLIIRHSSFVTLLLIALMPGLSVLSNFTVQDLRADRSAEHFAQTILNSAPADAIIITHRDAHTFTLWYYRLVEAQRPDIAVIDARLAGYPWYDPMLRAQDASLIRVEFDPETSWLDRLRAANPTRPVCDVDATTARLRCDIAGD